MRTHRTHRVLAPWSTGAPVADPARLAAVRIEPVLHQRRPALLLDLYLAGDGGDTVIPGVLVEPDLVVERERDPLVWPSGAPPDDGFALAVAERVLPHLEALVLAGEAVREHVLRFAAAPRFDAARAAECFGAAPLRASLVRLAPYLYARRFARRRTVRIDAPDAVGGWAVLRDRAQVGVAAERCEPPAVAWYGAPPPPQGDAEVALVGPGAAASEPVVLRLDAPAEDALAVVAPVPLDGSDLFDPAGGPVVRRFAVEAVPARVPPAPPAGYAALGGSAGRIAVVLGRPDAGRRPDADLDEAQALVAALRAEGFAAELCEPAALPGGADLVHLIGTRDGRRARAVVDAARRAGIPVALHAHDEDPAGGGWWGAAVTGFCFEYGGDERELASYLELLACRAVAVGAARADARFAPPEGAPELADAVLRDASIVFAASAAEADALRARSGRRGPVVVVPPLAPPPVDLVSPARLVGLDPFALVHAPIGPEGNQLLAAHAAAAAAVPLVLAGPVADASYLERVRAFGGPDLIVIADPAPAQAAALRAAAAVFVDVAWVGAGGARAAEAAAAGLPLVLADRRRLDLPGANVRRVDPADAAALARALGEAWDDALRLPRRVAPETAAALDPARVVRAIVRGYAAAPVPVA